MQVVPPPEQLREFSLEELRPYDGTMETPDGHAAPPIYVGVKGKVRSVQQCKHSPPPPARARPSRSCSTAYTLVFFPRLDRIVTLRSLGVPRGCVPCIPLSLLFLSCSPLMYVAGIRHVLRGNGHVRAGEVVQPFRWKGCVRRLIQG